MASAPEPDRAAALHRDAAAYRIFETARWDGGAPTCPHCGAAGRCALLAAPDGLARPTRTGRLTARRVWRCGSCRRQFSVLTETVFERTRVPLPVWLDALRILSTPGSEPSTADLARALGVTVDTARTMADLVRTGLAMADAPDCGSAQLQG